MVSALPPPVAALHTLSNHPLHLTTSDQESIRAAVSRWRPLVLVVIPAYARPETVVAITDTLGLRPTRVDGAWVWDLRHKTRLGPPVTLTEQRTA